MPRRAVQLVILLRLLWASNLAPHGLRVMRRGLIKVLHQCSSSSLTGWVLTRTQGTSSYSHLGLERIQRPKTKPKHSKNDLKFLKSNRAILLFFPVSYWDKGGGVRLVLGQFINSYFFPHPPPKVKPKKQKYKFDTTCFPDLKAH